MKKILMMVIYVAITIIYLPPAQAANNGINVLFIIVDDLNDWVDYMKGEAGGGPPAATPSFIPNIDALATSGVAFTRAYAAAPICTPSRSALLGGRRPGFTGVYDVHHDFKSAFRARGIVPLTKQFKANGYDVFGMGKVYHPINSPVAAYSNAELFTTYTPGSGKGGRGRFKLALDVPSMLDWGSPPTSTADSQMLDYSVATTAIDRINQPHPRPFFIAVGFAKPHVPWYVPAEYFDKFTLDDSLQPPTIADDLADVPAPASILAHQPSFQAPREDTHARVTAPTDNQWDAAVSGYLAAISFVDGQIGRVIDALNASTYKNDTIVVFTSDHGFHLGEKEHWHKATLWERALRVPLIFSGPGILAGGKSSRPVDLTAIYPTLTALTGVPAPTSGFDNVSIAPLLRNPSGAAPRPYALSTYFNCAEGAQGKAVHSVRGARFRYTLYADGSEELYDEQNDPNEWVNQASNPAFASNKASLRKYTPTATRQNRPPVACYPGPCPSHNGGGAVDAAED